MTCCIIIKVKYNFQSSVQNGSKKVTQNLYVSGKVLAEIYSVGTTRAVTPMHRKILREPEHPEMKSGDSQ